MLIFNTRNCLNNLLVFFLCFVVSFNVCSQDSAWPGLDLGVLSCPSTTTKTGNTELAWVDCGVSSAGDHMYRFSIAFDVDILIDLCNGNGGFGYDTEIHLFSSANGDCTAGAIATNNDVGGGCGGKSQITYLGLLAGSYVVVIEGDGADEGEYEMDITISNCVAPPVPLGPVPGGVGTGLGVWYRADAGITGSPVSQWDDQSSNLRNATQGGGGEQPAFLDGSVGINYNPTLSFDGAGDRLSFSPVGLPGGADLVHIYGVSTSNTNGGWRQSIGFGSDVNNFERYAIGKAGVGTGWHANMGIPTVDAISTEDDFINDQVVVQEGYYDGVNLGICTGGITRTTISATPSVVLLGGYVGSKSDGTGDYWSGKIAEAIIYSGNNTSAEVNKIESYLAVKYGSTLDITGGGINGDYVNTDGANIWDASVMPNYHNDVIGIGRDDTTRLMQKQSHTLDDTTRIYIDALATSNQNNTGSFSIDAMHILIGHDKAKMCATTASIAEIPGTCGLYSRLEREWKVSNTGFVDDFNLDLTLNTCANIALVTPSELRFLVDDDGDFSNGGTQCYANGDGSGIVISYGSPIITVTDISGVHIPVGETRYVTIGSILSSTPLPIKLKSFKADCSIGNTVNLIWTTLSETNNDYFTIERSRDGQYFEEIMTISGLGTSTSLAQYSWIDESKLSGTSYYRLSQTDYDGTSEELKTISVNCKGEEKSFLYPNPFDDEFVLQTKSSGIITILDNTGRLILTKEFNNGETLVQLDFVASGTYMAVIKLENGNSEMHKIIKF